MERVQLWLTNPAAWAVRAYRISRWLWVHNRKFLATLVMTVARIVTAIEIHPMAEIGAGFAITHGIGVVIGGFTIMGEECLVEQGVTMGARYAMRGGGKAHQHPHLGNRVFVGASAVLIGPITIGDDAKIGAGAVVLCDVPAGCTAVGNPARVLRPKGERETKASSCP